MREVIGLIVIAARDGHLMSLDFDDGRARMLAALTARYGPVRLEPELDPFGISSRIKAYLAGELGAVDDIPAVGAAISLDRLIVGGGR